MNRYKKELNKATYGEREASETESKNFHGQ